jgi:RND family efflux transporter MFP subunit
MKSVNELAPSGWRGIKSGVIGVAVAIAIVAALTALQRARVAQDEEPQPRTPLPVSTILYQSQDSYQRKVSYLGLVVAGRKANLGFEIPGQISTLPLRQGSPVQRGDIIATLDDAALQARRKATAADLEQARAELELAQLKARRQRELSETGAVSKQAYDETRLQARALGSRVEAVSARLASIDIELEKSSLIAPYDGVIADRYVSQGAVVSPGTPVVRLLETVGQEAHIGVSASRVGSLQAGNRYSLKLRDASFQAELLSVRPDVDPLTRATTAVFAIPEGVAALDGEPLTLELEEPVYMAGGWLPIAALLEGQRGVWTVLRIEPAGDSYRTAREAVEVLEIRGDQAYVRGTLASGSRVVANGVHRITPGTQVSVQEGS